MAERRLVVGDIHGCYYTMQKLLDEKIRLSSDDHIYFLGDYIDRGPRSRDVLEFMLKLKAQGYHVFFIKGNHELMLLHAMEDEQNLMHWFQNGAEETLQSFNVPEAFRYGQDALKSIPDEICNFLSGMPWYYELKDYVLVHAGLNFDETDVFSDTESMVWIRNYHYDGEKVGNKTIVHGHTPLPLERIIKHLNKKLLTSINLDAGCVYNDIPGYGNLVALDLDSRELFVQENVDM